MGHFRGTRGGAGRNVLAAHQLSAGSLSHPHGPDRIGAVPSPPGKNFRLHPRSGTGSSGLPPARQRPLHRRDCRKRLRLQPGFQQCPQGLRARSDPPPRRSAPVAGQVLLRDRKGGKRLVGGRSRSLEKRRRYRLHPSRSADGCFRAFPQRTQGGKHRLAESG